MKQSTRSTFAVRPSPLGDGVWIGVAVVLIAAAIGLSAPLADLGPAWQDPDSILRLVEVRDFLAGAGWSDLMQPRMGPDGVFMHWSRLADLPIAALVLLAEPFAGRAGAELFAVAVWPPLLMIPFAFGVASTAHAIGGLRAALIALTLTFLSPMVTGLFVPGRIDHHNLQAAALALCLAGLVRAERSPRAAAAAGVAAAFSLAIGLELMPALLAAAGCLALTWVVQGERWRKGLVAFSASFGVSIVAATVLTVAPDRWSIPVCDALSPAYAAIGGAGGLLMALGVGFARSRPGDGAAGLLLRAGTVIGVACLLVTATALTYPECLAGPYGQVDPRLHAIFLDHVEEAQSLRQILAYDPLEALGPYAASLLALAFAVPILVADPKRRGAPLLLLTALLAATTAVGLVQVRGMAAAQIVGAILGGVIAAGFAARTNGRDDLGAIALRLSFLPLAPLLWLAVGLLASEEETAAASTAPSAESCRTDFAATLAGLPPGLVASTTNFGSFLLFATPHRVLSAPYHRNTDGLVIGHAIVAGPDPEQAARQAGVDYVAVCRAEEDVSLYRSMAPDGLFPRIVAGERPGWLEPIAETPSVIVFRLAPASDDGFTGSLPPPKLRPTLQPSAGPRAYGLPAPRRIAI